MMTLAGICGVIALVGGGLYVLITVWSVFLGEKVEAPDFKRVGVREGVGVVPLSAPEQPGAHAGIGTWGMVAPGTFVLALVFLSSFVLYYFVNWKYLSEVWPLK
jgi:cytochrome c oxidase subunit 1